MNTAASGGAVHANVVAAVGNASCLGDGIKIADDNANAVTGSNARVANA